MSALDQRERRQILTSIQAHRLRRASSIGDFTIGEGSIDVEADLIFQDSVDSILKIGPPQCENRPLFANDFEIGDTLAWSE